MRIATLVTARGEKRVGLVEGEEVVDITCPLAPNVLHLVERASAESVPLTVVAERARKQSPGRRYDLEELDVAPARGRAYLATPIDPPEVWGAGITYERTATRYDEGAVETVYTRVYRAERPELFFKATASRCVGPNAPVLIRADSAQTSTEPEMAVVLGPGGETVAVLCCNDVTARDIELQNPLYLPQAKIYAGSCALGPWLTTVDEVPDLHALTINCTIERKGEKWQSQTNTALMRRTVPELVTWLTRNNPIPAGTVLTTGTGIVPPVQWCLQEGDRVTIEIEGVGRLANTVRKLGEQDSETI